MLTRPVCDNASRRKIRCQGSHDRTSFHLSGFTFACSVGAATVRPQTVTMKKYVGHRKHGPGQQAQPRPYMTSQGPRYTRTNGAKPPGLTAPHHDTPDTDSLASLLCGYGTGGAECLDTRRGGEQGHDRQHDDEQSRRSRPTGTEARGARSDMQVRSQQEASSRGTRHAEHVDGKQKSHGMNRSPDKNHPSSRVTRSRHSCDMRRNPGPRGT